MEEAPINILPDVWLPHPNASPRGCTPAPPLRMLLAALGGHIKPGGQKILQVPSEAQKGALFRYHSMTLL